MTLTDEARKIIDTETSVLEEVLGSLRNQKEHKLGRLRVEEVRSRELTSEIVRTRREEDRALLASDEAVSHGLKDRQKTDVAVIERMVRQPYFARMILEEPAPGGATKADRIQNRSR